MLSYKTFVAALFIVVSSLSVEPEPYELKYPANFGNRFTIPDDNPITKEGVALLTDKRFSDPGL